MSTEEILAALCQNDTLKQFKPPLSGNETTYRRIYLRPDVYSWLYPATTSPQKIIQYASDARRFLKSFIVGEDFDNVEKLKNLDVDELKKADEGVWAVRIKRLPQSRIFGSFAEKNIFVGTHKYDRGDLPEAEWITEKDSVKTMWSGRFKAISHSSILGVHQLNRLVGPSRAELTDNVRP